MDRRALAADHHRIDPPIRLAITPGRTLKQLGSGGNALAVGGVGEWIERVLEIEPRHVGERPRRLQGGMTHLIEPIEPVRKDRPAGSRRAAKFSDRHLFGPPARLLRRSIMTNR